MHTFKGKSCTIVHHGDYTGDIEIREGQVEDVAAEDEGRPRVTVAAEDIAAFVAEYVRLNRIEEIEQMEPDDVLLGIRLGRRRP